MEDEDPPSLYDLLHETATKNHLFHHDITSSSANAYLDQLVSLRLTHLSKEPALISSEASAVESELINLCYREYPTFISVHKCSAAIKSAFDDFEGSLNKLIGSVPILEEECRAFASKIVGIGVLRNRTILVKDHQDKLIDLLELPQLMETCARNGYYQEAMELADHARSLQAKSPGVKLVKDVAKEVEAVMQLMLAQLLALLREPVKLPILVKAITYLRRSQTMEEKVLGMVFLSSRLQNFRNQLVHAERDRVEPVRYLRKYIDMFREHVYDIVSQFTAVFEDTRPLIPFAGQCVADLVRLVKAYVPRIAGDSAALSSILVQLGYCSISFARVGLDFAPLIAAPFAGIILATYSHAVAAAGETLAGTLKLALKSSTAPVESMMDSEYRADVMISIPKQSITDGQPPAVSHIPPLARFLNDHLTALNTLRLLAPTALLPQLAAAQTNSLVSATTAILNFVQQAVSLPESSGGDRPKHSRTPSSPRSHLLRRNTETQLSPALRTLRRKENQRVCLSIADRWQSIIGFVSGALRGDVYGHSGEHVDHEVEEKLAELRQWIAQNQGSENSGENRNGVINEDSGKAEFDQLREKVSISNSTMSEVSPTLGDSSLKNSSVFFPNAASDDDGPKSEAAGLRSPREGTRNDLPAMQSPNILETTILDHTVHVASQADDNRSQSRITESTSTEGAAQTALENDALSRTSDTADRSDVKEVKSGSSSPLKSIEQHLHSPHAEGLSNNLQHLTIDRPNDLPVASSPPAYSDLMNPMFSAAPHPGLPIDVISTALTTNATVSPVPLEINEQQTQADSGPTLPIQKYSVSTPTKRQSRNQDLATERIFNPFTQSISKLDNDGSVTVNQHLLPLANRASTASEEVSVPRSTVDEDGDRATFDLTPALGAEEEQKVYQVHADVAQSRPEPDGAEEGAKKKKKKKKKK